MTSISRTLVLWLAVPLTLLSLGGALVHYFDSVAPQMIRTDRHLQQASQALAVQLGHADQPATVDRDIQFALRTLDGRLIAGNERLAPDPGKEKPGYRTAPLGGRSLRLLQTAVATPTGPAMLTVAARIDADEPAARYGFLNTLLWDFAQLDITLVLVWVGIRLGLRPVRRLRDEIAQRSAQDLRPISLSTVPREIAPLAATLNRLFALLHSSVQSQQQFIANTAHQLRTPITGMLAQLDLLAAEPAAEPVKHRLLTLQEGVRQLAHSANQLLALARADPSVNIAARDQAVELGALAGEVVARYFDRALNANIDLGAELRAASVRADSSLLDDLLSNLVDNALKYTPAGGSVTVSTGSDRGQPFMAVEDTGPGIPLADRARVRQRFVRLPNSPGHGSGLGLAIVDEIASLYSAKVSIDPGPGDRGTKITVRFPAAAGCA